MKNHIFKIFQVLLVLLFSYSNLFGQCIQEGFRTEASVNIGSSSSYDNKYRSEIVIGQSFISGELNSFNGSSATGFWSPMYNPPVVANLDASDGIHEDRISLSWSLNENTPAVTEEFKIYRDGYLIGTVGENDYSFIDYNVVPGVYYTYSVAGVNNRGIGIRTSDLGYVNPNGVISGRITTFSGNSVEGALVSLSPSNNLSVRFSEQGGIYVDTLDSDPNPLVNGEFTVSLWAKVLSYASEGILFDYGMATGENFWIGVQSDSTIYVTMADQSGNKTVAYTIPGLNTQHIWHNIAAAYNGRDLMLLFDGKLVGSIPVDINNTIFANNRIGIGSPSDPTSVNNLFNGYIDEVRVLDRVQRPSEIKKFMYNTIPTTFNGLVAYWKMDEGVGDRAINQVQPERVSVVCNSTFDSNEEPGMKISGVSNSAGYYLIESVNYGSGTSFDVIPEKYVSYNTALEFSDIESNYAVTPAFGIPAESSIDLWVNPYHYNGTQYLLSADGALAFDLYLNGNDLHLNINGDDQVIANLSGLGYKYISLNRTLTGIEVRINNGAPQTFSFSYTAIVPPTTWQMGRSAAGTNYYSGLIDGLIVWNEPLTPQEIDANNNIGVHSITIEQNGLEVLNDKLEVYIHLNDQKGAEIVNEIPVEGALTYGNVFGAQFVDEVAHENGINHQFNPNSRIVTLNNSNTSADQIDFVDITTIPVSGIVKYDNSNCYIPFAEILVDGATSSPPTFTDAEGAWTLDVEPGETVKLSAKFQNHAMEPYPFFEIRNIQSPKGGVAFYDQEMRIISGVVAGGICHYPIIAPGKTMEVSLEATNGCYSDAITLDENSGINFVFDSVPPGEYTVSVTHSDGLFPGSIGEYFGDLGGVTIDVVSQNANNINFIYRSGHNLEVESLPTNTCGDVVLIQGIPITLDIKVYEEYLGQKCYLDTADIIVSEGIGESTISGFTGTYNMTNGIFQYRFAPGQANIVAPYLKSTQIFAEVDGASVSHSYDAVVLGKRKRATTFTSTTPEMPLTILRDPQGDGSFAYIETNEEVCMTNITFTTEGQTVGNNFEVYAGADLTTSVGIGAETELEVNVTANFGVSGSVSDEGTVTNEYTNCITMTEILETTTSLGDITGSGADIYIGAALNVEYGLTDILSYDEGTCSYSLSTELMVDPKEFSTFYAYSEYHLVNDVIPSNYLLGDTASAEAWEGFIDLNQTAKNQAIFQENRSFDAGSVYSASMSTAQTSTITRDFSMTLDNSVYGAVGIEVNGIGVNLALNQDFSITYGGSNSQGVTNSKTVGYTLADDDLGDNFTMNIYKDPMFGTPVFTLISGESSCPHEQGTLPREGVQVLVDNLKKSTKINVSTDQAALFDLYLGNTSQSSETMTYQVDVVNSSNPDGAVLSINGNVLGSGPLNYSVDPNIAEFATLALERGANPNIFDYDSILVVFQSICDGNISDTVMVSAHFVEPCSSVDISSPANNWVLTPADNGVLPIVITGYDETDPDLELIRIQYRAQGSASWLNIKEILTPNLGAVTTQVDWNIGSLNDGAFEIRALSQCVGGLPTGYSNVIPGIIEQESPEILGIPQPADGVLHSGDEISVKFTENINCNVIYQADQNNLNNIGLYNLTTNQLVNANIQCNGNKITITPLIPSIYLENQTLEVRITEIEDLVGNVMGTDNTGSMIHKWDFYVNVSPVGWIGAEVEEIKELNVPHSFQRAIENNGGTSVLYDIITPPYISASPSSGSLPAGNQQVVTFTVDNQLANGQYLGDLELQTSYGSEILPMDLRVMCEAPAWSVDAAQYDFNMNFTLELNIAGEMSDDEYDMISAYINNEVRGVANVQYVSALDKYLAFLSVYGDAIENGDEVSFRIWDASECQLYEQTYETYPFATNGQIGTPTAADTIHTMNLLAKTIYLNDGWNWISFNLDLNNDTVNEVLSPLSNPANGQIKSQTQFSQYYAATSSWVGVLETIDETELYKVHLDADDSLTIYGTPMHVDSNLIPINVGWNWIGYLPQGGMSPDHGLQSLSPLTGDVIKNQYFFAQYVGGIGWIGNLTYLNAPSGYLYKSSFADTLHYPVDPYTNPIKAGSGEIVQNEIKANVFAEFMQANVSPTHFSGNMNLIGRGILNDNVITDHGDKVYAYIEGQIRGVIQSMNIPAMEEYSHFLTIYGNPLDEGKTITMMYYDASTGSLHEVLETFTYHENSLIGLVEGMQSLTLGTIQASNLSEIDLLTTNYVNVYPNPAEKETVIELSARDNQVISISIHDHLGKLVAKLDQEITAGTNQILLEELLPMNLQSRGLYSISVVMDGHLHHVKLVISK